MTLEEQQRMYKTGVLSGIDKAIERGEMVVVTFKRNQDLNYVVEGAQDVVAELKKLRKAVSG